ncbi:MAG TPA: deoxyribodipyrimidine photo-lyase [Gammaproteobacteria bacterium]|nr:deoxyribodipyrimidine photo-lyase [Gammaproteobacteria bacterium]
MMRGLIWLRTDLRLHDNSALFHGSNECRDGLLAVHFIPKALHPQAHLNPRQYQLQATQIKYLHQALANINIPLQIRIVDTMDDIPAQILNLMQTHQIDTLYFNERYDLPQRTQDRTVVQVLETESLRSKHYADHVIAPPQELLTPKDKPFTSQSAFKKTWQGFLRHANLHSLGKIEKQTVLITAPTALPALPFESEVINAPWALTEQHALAILRQESHFAWDAMDPQTYTKHTHQLHALFAHLNNGLLSPRQFIRMLLQGDHVQNKAEVDKWFNILIAREFDMHIMYHFPHICGGHDFAPHTHALPWKREDTLLHAWQSGHTGFPLIDASMRCLNQTGYLSEDLLQASALFFTKILFLDYRLGEEYFTKQRLDHEFASNNSLWQYCASTGAESVIYSRIPQPARQSEVFDSQGDLIRKYCPELADIHATHIHDPHMHIPAVMKETGYPQPIVDYALMRKKTLYHFKALNKTYKNTVNIAQ